MPIGSFLGFLEKSKRGVRVRGGMLFRGPGPMRVAG
jgi:hypothetical protein